MYSIRNNPDYLIIELKSDFDEKTLQSIINESFEKHNSSCRREIWHIGHHSALLKLGDLLDLVETMGTSCAPKNCAPNTPHCDKKVAFVVTTQGLTLSIVELLSDGITRAHPFKSRVFNTHDDAVEWIES